MVPVILELIAARPTTPGPVLSDLARWAGADTSATWTRTHTARHRVRAALAMNPHLDPGALTDLIDQHPETRDDALTRPGMTAEQTIALLDQSTASARIALRYNPSDDLAQHLLNAAGGARIWQEILHTPSLSAHFHLEAATRLARRDTHTARDVEDIVRIARQQPGALNPDVAGSPGLRGALDMLAAGRDRGTDEGCADWYAHPTTTDADIVTHLREHHANAAQWVTALREHATPALAAAALLHAPKHLSVLTEVLVGHHTPTSMRYDVLCTLAGAPSVARSAREQAGALLPDAPMHVVVAYAPAVTTQPEAQAILGRTDLPAQVLDALTYGFHCSRCPVGTAAPDLLAEYGLWGVTLALHPNSTPAQRQQGLTLAQSRPVHQTANPTITAALERERADILTLATLGRRLTLEEPAPVGADVPVPALRQSSLRDVTPLRHLIDATLDAHTPLLLRPGVGRALVALADSFTGTVGELLLAAATIAA